jgi:hypothetical protein
MVLLSMADRAFPRGSGPADNRGRGCFRAGGTGKYAKAYRAMVSDNPETF